MYVKLNYSITNGLSAKLMTDRRMNKPIYVQHQCITRTVAFKIKFQVIIIDGLLGQGQQA